MTDDYSSLEDIACEPWLACICLAITAGCFWSGGIASGSVLLLTAEAVAGVAAGYGLGLGADWLWQALLDELDRQMKPYIRALAALYDVEDQAEVLKRQVAEALAAMEARP